MDEQPPRIHVRRARADADLDAALHLRWRGYRKYFADDQDPRDGFDEAPGCLILLAEDDAGTPLGTLRVLDRRLGPVELDRFIDLDALVPATRQPLGEVTRLSIPRHPHALWIKWALWKTVYRYGQAQGLRAIVLSVRPAAARAYRALDYEWLGAAGDYRHPELGGLPHQTFLCDLDTLHARYRASAHPMYRFGFLTAHPELRFD